MELERRACECVRELWTCDRAEGVCGECQRLRFFFGEGERTQVRGLGHPITVARVALDRKARGAERTHVAIDGARSDRELLRDLAREIAEARAQEQGNRGEPLESGHIRSTRALRCCATCSCSRVKHPRPRSRWPLGRALGYSSEGRFLLAVR
jgi:hypothetical protein